MKNYLYKNIICYQTWGTWSADYCDGKGNRFALHRECCATKTKAYAIAKEDVDYLNQNSNADKLAKACKVKE